jgi:hypothetical protein
MIPIALALFLVILFSWPLFAWSPVKIGYKSYVFEKYDVFIHHKTPLEYDLEGINRLFTENEEHHRLSYNKKVGIFLCKNLKEINDCFPLIRIKASGFTINTGDKVFVNLKRMEESDIDLYELIKHELSHDLLYHNMDFLKTFDLSQWFREGVAVYFGGPRYERSKEELKAGFDSMKIDYNDTLEKLYIYEPNGNRNMRYSYILYGWFIAYLDDNWGRDKLIDFIHRTIMSPKEIRDIFHQIYTEKLIDVFERYKSSLNY